MSSPSQDPWTVLGVNRQANEREIKSAYARLLKVHRPEVDSEGFQRLRLAYEQLSRQCRDVARQFHVATESTGPTPPMAPVTETPSSQEERTAVGLALEALATAIAKRIRRDIRETLSDFDRAADAAALSVKQRSHHLCTVFAAQISLLAEICSRERILRHLEGGDVKLPQAMVAQWSTGNDGRKLGEVADALASRDMIAKTEDGASLAVQVAIALGPWDPERALALMNPAFAALPLDRRAKWMMAAEVEIQVGRMLVKLPHEDKTFWLDLMRGKRKPPSWRDTTSRQLLAVVLRHCGPDWTGFACLRRILAPGDWAEMVAAARSLFR